MLPTSLFRSKAKGLPDLLNYGAFVDPGIMMNKDGSLTSGFFYRSQDISSATPLDRNIIAARMNQVMAKLGNGWAIHIDASRIPIAEYPARGELFFEDEITALMDEERRQFFENEGFHYETIYTFILTYKPETMAKSKIADMMFEDGNKSKKSIATKVLEEFKNKLNEFEDNASTVVRIQRMKTNKVLDQWNQAHYQDELLEFINYTITGERHPVNLPPIPMYMDSYIGCHNFFGGVTPKLGDKFIGVIAIDGFPQESVPNILEALGQLSIEYRWNTRFIFKDPYEAEKLLNKDRKKAAQKIRPMAAQIFNTGSTQVDQHAVEMVAQFDNALAEIKNGIVSYGWYNSSIVVMEKDRERLEYFQKEVSRIIFNLGFNARIEDINAVEAWLGTLPGHTIQNPRRPTVNTMNLSHLMPLSSIWAGDKYNSCDKYPPKSPALIYTSASGSTPFRLNLHVTDIGHTLVFGPTGAGKSTLLATMVSQSCKYQNIQNFAFDKGNSLYALTAAAGGSHYEIGGENQKLSFAPLANIDSDNEQAWCEEWVENCLILQGVTVTPEHRKAIHAAMKIQRNTESTSMTDFVTNIQDSELKAALGHYTLSGAMGHLLDGEEDSLKLSNFSTFELEDLMNLGEKNVVPVLLYLFHRIEKALDGRPTFLWLDEAWIMLGHPVFREKIREWLKVLRKANCAVVLLTQSLSDAGKSGILDVLQESCPTKIFLPNPQAFNRGTESVFGPYDYYKQFGLNDAQIGIIASAIPKKQYFYTSENGTRLFDLALGPVALSFVAASSKDQVKECKRLVEKYGAEWPYQWMNSRNVDYEKYSKKGIA